MKFLVLWRMHEGKLHDTLELFTKMSPEQEQAPMQGKVKLIGRWHDATSGRGAAVFETDSLETLMAYALNWNRFMDLETFPVIDDEETRAIGRQMAARG
jgi:hypothetical protein